MQIGCWSRTGVPMDCDDEAAQPDLDACAADLARTHSAFLAEHIWRELGTCMSEKGWRVGDGGQLFM
ncbi:hypothetical protein LF41_2655 [Lysobacter dokdonensis DS-58]|uniref:Uncharacterized protein n=1 Tax=Lysobacter dokdonensis DS-58 TaxID=1300345 RepID=A0A0A2WLX7_9GAMM|nr:hypothetical protein [Lysobacter dokdonensis]KGQ19717.1 hypothetical protein LF41_2655 [Lysobacter dokdonensis DS-58]